MCTFCVVPFTRGRERSRRPESIVAEVNDLANKGYKEVTLLGQNVDSYLWYGGGLKKDFHKASPIQQATAIDFAGLLKLVAEAQPYMRIRFSTSNPQDKIGRASCRERVETTVVGSALCKENKKVRDVEIR